MWQEGQGGSALIKGSPFTRVHRPNLSIVHGQSQMNSLNLDAEPALSDSDRSLLRKSVRDFLSKNWPADHAVENAGDVEVVVKLWRGMAAQGLASLGSDATEAGLREIVLVFEELG